MGGVIDKAINVASLGTINTDLSGRKAGEAALRSQNSAREIADKELQDAYEVQRGFLNPYLESGRSAIEQLAGGKFDFQADPSYQFRLQEGNKALTNAAAARGLNRSGATLKALGKYGSDLASQEYGNAYNRNFNRLSQLSGMGQNAANSLSDYFGRYKNQVAANRMGFGNAQAAQGIAANNADNALINQGIQLGTTYLSGGFDKLAGLGGLGAGSGANNVSAQVMPANSLSGNYSLGDYGANKLTYRYGGV